jgi:hypothetical protein
VKFRKVAGDVPVLGVSESGQSMQLTVGFVGFVDYDRDDSEALAKHLEAAADMVRRYA